MRFCRLAAASALRLLAHAAAGCGFGAGAGTGEVTLTVTRDYGATQMLGPLGEEVSEADTVMRVLEGEAEISTRYGGGYVDSIDGVAETLRDGRRYDWFFYVDGVESPIGAAEFDLSGGEDVWWDYRDWTDASRIAAPVGAWPAPLVGGYEGKVRPVALECWGAGPACGRARERLVRAGVKIAIGSPKGAIRVLVGPWARLRSDPAAAQLESGPQASGVFAELGAEGGSAAFAGLDQNGEPVRRFGPEAGLVAATRRFDNPPVWLVTGLTAHGALAAAELLDAESLARRYAVASEGGVAIPLPIAGGSR